jgi:class 3 adenylate cyclase
VSDPFDELGRLLAQREDADGADARAAIDARIHERFGATRAVMLTDLAGFSRITKDHGILHFLAMIERMKRLCAPVITDHGGSLIKMIGDDMFCGFSTAEGAVRAAIDMVGECQRDGSARPENDRVELAVGIGFGQLIDLDGRDLFGDEVNRASKLGEDIAKSGEILVTSAVAENTGTIKGWWLEQRNARISGISFDYFAATQNN